jgi:hypothetical protein
MVTRGNVVGLETIPAAAGVLEATAFTARGRVTDRAAGVRINTFRYSGVRGKGCDSDRTAAVNDDRKTCNTVGEARTRLMAFLMAFGPATADWHTADAIL